MITERWLPVPGFEEAYEVSDLGRVRSLDRIITTRHGVRKNRRGVILRVTTAGTGGYPMVSLGRATKRTVHSLVMETFVGPCPPGQEVRHHPDPNPLNVALTNLRYGTRSENNLDQVEHGNHWAANVTHCPTGHEYTVENTYVYRGSRFCRACNRERSRQFRAK